MIELTEKEIMQMFARTILLYMEDNTGVIVECQGDKKKRAVIRKGVNIQISNDDYPDLPEGLKIRVAEESNGN